MVDKVEVQEGLDAETLAWIEEEEKKAEIAAAKIASGEIPQTAIAGWSSENWQTKASAPAPDDIE